MRRLDRYILREIFYPTMIALAALTFVAITHDLGKLLEFIVRRGATPGEIWSVTAALLPNVLTFTLPMAVLVGILTGFGRMSSDSEIVAMRAAGVSMRRILVPVMVLGGAAWLVNIGMSGWFAPEMSVRFNLVRNEILLRQASLEVQPGVFNEDIQGVAVYVRSVSQDRSIWHGMMLADMRNPDNEKIMFAATGIPILKNGDHSFQVTLQNGISHTIYNASSQNVDFEAFGESTIPLPLPAVITSAQTTPVSEASTRYLWRQMRTGSALYEERVEFHRRFALPFACLAFVLVGLPLGVSTTRGSKSMGLVMSLILMFIYYLAFFAGTRLASDRSFSPLLGAWIPNIAFLMVGIFLLARADREHENHALMWIRAGMEWMRERLSVLKRLQQHITSWIYSVAHRSKTFRIIDRYVIRGFCFYFLLVLVSFVALFTVVTLFELLPDIVKNHASTTLVVLYFIFYTPQMLFWVVPLTVLLAILINLGTLTKSNEILAVKAAGMSLYRLSMPMLLMGLLVSCAVYLMQEYMLPYTNQRQDQYHDIIKGHPPQTYRHPDRKWMAGSDNRIYHYNQFDYEKNRFVNLSVFKFDSDTFKLREWIFASSANWNGNGWVLGKVAVHRISTDGADEADEFVPTLAVTDMDSPAYFKDEVRTASQMTYSELGQSIESLRKKQFDVTSLQLDLYRKLSFPLVSFIMALIGIPFSFKTGKKGAFYGIGFCVGLGILYWSTFELFDKLGDVNRLSPMIAAWFPNLIFGLTGTWMMLRVKT